MRAMSYAAYGGPEVLKLVEVPRPTPGPGQILLKVVAGSVNPIDWKMASGKLRLVIPAKFPAVPGYDVAGEVAERGPGVTGFPVGTRVHARIGEKTGGGAAEYALVGTDVAAEIPAGMDFGEAAGLPLAGMTALQALRDLGGLPLEGSKQRVLVVGASGGVGHFGVQIAHVAGAQVVGVCSAANAALVRSLGADEVVDYRAADPYRGQAPFDIVLDCVGADPAPWLPLLAPAGTYVTCLPGPAVLLRAMVNPLTSRKVRAILLKSNAVDLRILDGLVASGRLRVVVDSRHPLEALGKAWERSQTGRVVGKVIVEVG